MDLQKLIEKDAIIKSIAEAQECIWFNPQLKAGADAFEGTELAMDDINDAEERLIRFAPFIMRCFPETEAEGGIIESPLRETEGMRRWLNAQGEGNIGGRLLVKLDSHLAIAGSVKARGGIYEILKHTEDIAIEKGLLTGIRDDYGKLADESCRRVFSGYTVQVGSTGNLGLSIGIMSAAVGYRVIVHMSADAKQWKKEMLRSRGVTVVEYQSDYSEAVKRGRALSEADPKSYFVDDENSVELFLGYAVAAKRLKAQLEEKDIAVDKSHPLFVYIPCGVGGAPGGVAFGLRLLFGDNVHIFFAEPTQAPCMLLGMASGLNGDICVQDVGLTGQTHADGLAVGRPSGFVGRMMKGILAGGVTLDDHKLYDYMRGLLNSEGIFIEPSACAAFEGPLRLCSGGKEYIERHGLDMDKAVHVCWATGGRLVPEEIRRKYIETYL